MAAPALTREQWLAERKSYIGATDLAAIVGKNKYRTALDVFLDKTGAKSDESSARKAQAGLALEPLIKEWFEEDTGLKVLPGRMVRHPEHPFLAANLDGETTAGDLVEAKSMDFTTKDEWGEPGTDEVPEAYYVQAVVQLGYVALERAMQGLTPPRINWIPRLDRGTMKLDVYAVEPQPDIFEVCVQAGRVFFENMQKGVPPEPTVRDADNLIHLFPQSTGEILVSDPVTDELVSAYHDAWQRQKRAESEVKDFSARLKLAIADASGLDTVLGRFSLTRMPGKVSWQKVAAEFNPSDELIARHTGAEFLTLKTPFKAEK